MEVLGFEDLRIWGFRGLGFRVWGLGLGVWDSGFGTRGGISKTGQSPRAQWSHM